MASVHAGGSRARRSVGGSKKEKIQVDDFNTAALDNLLLGDEPPAPKRSATIAAVNPGKEEEWDPFANKEGNVYNDSQPEPVSVPDTQQQKGASSNIFGDDPNDMWGDNQPIQSQPQTKQEQKQVLDDILGDDNFHQSSANPAAVASDPPGSDFNMLKNLYNTATAAQNQPGTGMNQQNYYNTGMGGGYNDPSMGGGYNDPSMGGGYNNMGGGYGGQQNFNTGMGGGYGAQPNQYNTGYGGGGVGYNDPSMGYNNGYNQPNQYSTGYGGGAPTDGTGYNYQNNTTGYNQASNPGYNTSAPGGQPNQNNDFDPFS